jgi:DNA topoisomerase-2
MTSKKNDKNKAITSNSISIEEQYKKKSLHQHILDLPDTYIGSVQNDLMNIYVYDDDENKIIKKDRHVTLGLYKIFDEVLVNASDNTVRDKKCNKIMVDINKETGELSIWNNGSSIPIEIHKEYNIYVPELIFGNLLTSGNYDQKGKTVGGKNGLGSKVANIYSTKYEIEICDPIRKKKYFQRFTDNMYNKEEPIITTISSNTESYTKITFLPDYKRFGLKKLSDDMASLLKRRVYDTAGTTIDSVSVWLNGTQLNIKSFKDYIGMYYSEDDVPDLIYEEFNERWTIGVVYDPNAGFQHMSFVNKISTFKGGSHLNYITNQIVDKVIDHIISQPKYKTLKIKPHQIKENLTIFINSVIEDPSFSSQTKEELTTKSSLFNIKCELDDRFISKICKTGLINEIVQVAQIKQLGELEKSDGKKNSNLKNLTKLDF